MTELREFTEFADGPMVFPYKGKTYAAPEITIEMGIRLSGITNDGQEQDVAVHDLAKDLLGPVYDEMVADGVPSSFLTRVFMTIVADFQYGRTYAEAMWETGADPKAMVEWARSRGNRATRRSKSTGGARRTP